MNENLHEKIYIVIRNILKKILPEELPFFELGWERFKEILEEWSKINPREWSLREYKTKALPYFSYPEKFDGLKMHSLSLAISSIMFELNNLPQEVSEDKIKEITRFYAKKYGISSYLIPKIISFLTDSIKIISSQPTDKKERLSEYKKFIYEVYKNGERYLMTPEEVNELEKKKKDFFVWVWVDDEKSEVIIDNKETDIKPDSISFKFLREILKHVGKDLPHDTIYKNVTTGYIHQNLHTLKNKTGKKLNPFISGEKRYRFSIKKFNSCLITKKSFK